MPRHLVVPMPSPSAPTRPCAPPIPCTVLVIAPTSSGLIGDLPLPVMQLARAVT